MNVKHLSIVATSLALGAGAATAGGYTPPVVEPVLAPVVEEPIANWAGGYAGVTLGYAFGGKDRVGISDAETDTLLGNIGEMKGDGVNAGVRVGYRWQRDRWVFGPELAWEGGDVKGDTSGTIGGTELEAEAKLKSMYALRFKTGYIVQPNTMVYGIVGYGRADVDYKVAGQDVGFDTDGYIVGLGVERQFTDRVSLTAEYEYANFGKEELEAVGYTTQATIDYSNIKLGLNFRF
ncbi:MAG TPA: outer membrane beta-barrel protein [Paracoccus sp. (in: a-proteobacteria)]|uniref:outer membrane protein n=1 Tax=Paracoccus sp. TaxID=267 RepID=UPI002C9FD8FB|nr:outer membrane beta-barrel protein [Paracoccus sp. (in: a-proteobacteria)]HWL58328.1 outer membrane beta-barrel protein [Paracoccus sp. (in: a-proteobacteria)]